MFLKISQFLIDLSKIYNFLNRGIYVKLTQKILPRKTNVKRLKSIFLNDTLLSDRSH